MLTPNPTATGEFAGGHPEGPRRKGLAAAEIQGVRRGVVAAQLYERLAGARPPTPTRGSRGSCTYRRRSSRLSARLPATDSCSVGVVHRHRNSWGEAGGV